MDPKIEDEALHNTPTLFRPLKIRGLELRNRIVVSPMGMYSSQSPAGELSDFHLMHHGHFAFRGAALTIVEATAILPNGRTSPSDAGLWSSSQIPSFKAVVDFVHSLHSLPNSPKIGIQLNHGGRKTSMLPIEIGKSIKRAGPDDGGWEDSVWGPSAVPFMENYFTPREMSVAQIAEVVRAFGKAAGRAVECGFDLIEIHAAHGYLLSSFLSPASNHRTDSYGGSFENRTRFLLEVVHEIRRVIPEAMPFSVRISAVDWMAHEPETPQWTLDDSIRLALVLADMGVDVLDVSSGGNNALQKIPSDARYQIDLASQIKATLRANGKDMLVAAVGRIASAEVAEEVVREGHADLAFVATQFLRDPNLVHTWAEELGANVPWPRQYARADRAAKLGTL